MLAGISSCTTGQTGTQGSGKLAITSQITPFFTTIRSNLETGTLLCKGVCQAMLQAREKFNTRWTWMLHQYANEGLQTWLSLYSKLFLENAGLCQGYRDERKKFFCNFNAFHCAALRGEMERKRKQSEGWQKTLKKDLSGKGVVEICCQLTSYVANDAKVKLLSFFSLAAHCEKSLLSGHHAQAQGRQCWLVIIIK